MCTPKSKLAILTLEYRNTLSEWTAEFDFRATGPERGGGNLQIWYTKEGQANVGTSSVYTVGKFDGLVLVVDMYGGRVFCSHLCNLCADANTKDRRVAPFEAS